MNRHFLCVLSGILIFVKPGGSREFTVHISGRLQTFGFINMFIRRGLSRVYSCGVYIPVYICEYT